MPLPRVLQVLRRTLLEEIWQLLILHHRSHRPTQILWRKQRSQRSKPFKHRTWLPTRRGRPQHCLMMLEKSPKLQQMRSTRQMTRRMPRKRFLLWFVEKSPRLRQIKSTRQMTHKMTHKKKNKNKKNNSKHKKKLWTRGRIFDTSSDRARFLSVGPIDWVRDVSSYVS